MPLHRQARLGSQTLVLQCKRCYRRSTNTVSARSLAVTRSETLAGPAPITCLGPRVTSCHVPCSQSGMASSDSTQLASCTQRGRRAPGGEARGSCVAKAGVRALAGSPLTCCVLSLANQRRAWPEPDGKWTRMLTTPSSFCCGSGGKLACSRLQTVEGRAPSLTHTRTWQRPTRTHLRLAPAVSAFLAAGAVGCSVRGLSAAELVEELAPCRQRAMGVERALPLRLPFGPLKHCSLQVTRLLLRLLQLRLLLQPLLRGCVRARLASAHLCPLPALQGYALLPLLSRLAGLLLSRQRALLRCTGTGSSTPAQASPHAAGLWACLGRRAPWQSRSAGAAGGGARTAAPRPFRAWLRPHHPIVPSSCACSCMHSCSSDRWLLVGPRCAACRTASRAMCCCLQRHHSHAHAATPAATVVQRAACTPAWGGRSHAAAREADAYSSGAARCKRPRPSRMKDTGRYSGIWGGLPVFPPASRPRHWLIT